jgi:hypothetical protein
MSLHLGPFKSIYVLIQKTIVKMAIKKIKLRFKKRALKL